MASAENDAGLNGLLGALGKAVDAARSARRCPVHHLPRTADTWMAACTCPSTAHGIEEAD